jgi:isoamylase
VALRERQKRNLMATLLLSQGVPMICGGDELGRTQGGNNNGYCQDNEISWLDWSLDEDQRRLLDFTSRLVHLRHQHPNLRRRNFFLGRPIHGAEVRDIIWLRPDGQEMTDAEWSALYLRSLGMLIAGEPLDAALGESEPAVDAAFLLLVNAYWEGVVFTIPAPPAGARWEVVADTDEPHLEPGERFFEPGSINIIGPRSLALLRETS